MSHEGHNMPMATTLAVLLNTSVDPHAGMNHAMETTKMDHDMGSMDMSSMNMAVWGFIFYLQILRPFAFTLLYFYTDCRVQWLKLK